MMKMITSLFNDKAERIIRQKIIAEHKMIKVEPGKCRFNFRCSFNAVHEAVKHNHKKVAMVVYFDGGYPIIHFINYKKGRFIDNTLGHWASQYEYYFIKFIDKEEFWDIGKIFSIYRKHLQNCLPYWVRKLNTQDF